MDNFMRLQDEYRYASIWSVARRAYTDSDKTRRLLLWLSTTSLLLSVTADLLNWPNAWGIFLLLEFFAIWYYCFNEALKSAFPSYYQAYLKPI